MSLEYGCVVDQLGHKIAFSSRFFRLMINPGKRDNMETEPQEKVRKIYSDKDGFGFIICESCGFSKKALLVKYKHLNQALKVKCQCGHISSFTIEGRKYYRKPTAIKGIYRNLSSTSFEEEKLSHYMIVNDLSLAGIGFSALGNDVSVNDILHVTCTLDDRRESVISQRVIVRRVEGQCIGAEFISQESYRKELGFYLMTD